MRGWAQGGAAELEGRKTSNLKREESLRLLAVAARTAVDANLSLLTLPENNSRTLRNSESAIGSSHARRLRRSRWSTEVEVGEYVFAQGQSPEVYQLFEVIQFSKLLNWIVRGQFSIG